MTVLKATDERDGEASVENWYQSPREWAFGLDVDGNATSVDLTLAFHRTRYAEFVVVPRIIVTNDARLISARLQKLFLSHLLFCVHE